MGVGILSSCAILPARRVVSGGSDTTGISQLRYALESQQTSDLAALAVDALLPASHFPAALLVGTTSSDTPSPATAHRVAAKLNFPQHTFCCDVTSSCTSFLSAVIASQGFLKADATVCVVGAELKHRQISDVNIRLKNLFSDGAGAMLLSQNKNALNGIELVYSKIRPDLVENIQVQIEMKTSQPQLSMLEPRRMYREIIRELHDAILEVWDKRHFQLKQQGLIPERIQGMIFVHQANAKLLLDLKSRLPEHIAARIPVLMSDIGNTVSASLPMLRARSLFLLACETSKKSDVKTEEGVQVSYAEWRSEKIIIKDYFVDELLPWRENITQDEKNFFKSYAKAYKSNPLSPHCDIWISAGGGFQTLGCIHTYF